MRVGKFKAWSGAMLVLALIGIGVWFLSSREPANRNVPRQVPTQVKTTDQSTVNAGTSIESAKANEQERRTLNITFRAVGLDNVSQGADQEIGFAVLNEIKNSPYFDSAKGTYVSAEVPLSEQAVRDTTSGSPGTFSFKIEAKLKRPLKL